MKLTMDDDAVRQHLEQEAARLMPLMNRAKAIAKVLTGADLALSDLTVIADLLSGQPAEVPAAEPDGASPKRPKLRQNEKGSAAWEAGRMARDNHGFHDADLPVMQEHVAFRPYTPDSVQDQGFGLGWAERNAELVADCPTSPAPLSFTALRATDQSAIQPPEVHPLAAPSTLGYQAHTVGRPRSGNPYANGTEDFKDWRSGWDNAHAAAEVTTGEEIVSRATVK